MTGGERLMYGSQTPLRMTAAQKEATLKGADVTLNEQLLRDSEGKLRDEVLDELALAAQEIELALGNKLNETNVRVLRDLLAAVRLGETIVSETWELAHR
jgi:hypothetical protein